MSSMGVVLDKIRERRVRAGYHEALEPREHIPPDLAVPCARYPLTAFICFLAVAGAMVAALIPLVVMLVRPGSAPTPAAKVKAAPRAMPNVSPRR